MSDEPRGVPELPDDVGSWGDPLKARIDFYRSLGIKPDPGVLPPDLEAELTAEWEAQQRKSD